MLLQESNPAAAFTPSGLGFGLPGSTAHTSPLRNARLSRMMSQEEGGTEGVERGGEIWPEGTRARTDGTKTMLDTTQNLAGDPRVAKSWRVRQCLMADKGGSLRKPVSKEECLAMVKQTWEVVLKRLFRSSPRKKKGSKKKKLSLSGSFDSMKRAWSDPEAVPDYFADPNSVLRKAWRLVGIFNPIRNCYAMFRPTLMSMSDSPTFLGLMTNPLVVNENLNFLWFYNIGLLYYATYIQRNKALPAFMYMRRDGRFYILLDVMMSMFSIALALPIQSIPYVIQKGLIGQAYVALCLIVMHWVAFTAARGILTNKKHDDDWGLSHLGQSARIHSTAAGSVLD